MVFALVPSIYKLQSVNIVHHYVVYVVLVRRHQQQLHLLLAQLLLELLLAKKVKLISNVIVMEALLWLCLANAYNMYPCSVLIKTHTPHYYHE
uniref:Uncharacterized protein n=1 Tax=Acrobeloides nanus TaxID=290746 RepID=A0A914DT12_9BILA